METKLNFTEGVALEMEGTPTELAMGVTTEEMRAMFFNATILREPSYSLRQLNSRGKRYYYTFLDDEPVFFPSVTTILKNVMPENKFLTEWKLSLGKEEAIAYTMERARYGSFVHGQIAELMIARKYNLDLVRERLAKYVEREQLPLGFVDAHEEEAKADIKAFSKWMKDYDVQPLAVEVALYSPMYGYAGMIDCVCSMRKFYKEDKKNSKNEERINAIVDFKSGKKGFYDDYAIQLELYRMMWNENFPDTIIERIFNIAPKDWLRTVKKVPSYNFEEQTENPVLRKIPHLLALNQLEEEEMKKITIVSGEIDLDSDDDNNVQILSLADLVKSHKKEQLVETEDTSDSLF